MQEPRRYKLAGNACMVVKWSEILRQAKMQERVREERFQMNFTQLVATFGYWVVLVFVAIQCAGIPFPGGAVLLAAAIYAGTTHQLAVMLIILAAAAGAILGNLLGYLLGSRG